MNAEKFAYDLPVASTVGNLMIRNSSSNLGFLQALPLLPDLQGILLIVCPLYCKSFLIAQDLAEDLLHPCLEDHSPVHDP